MHDNTNLTVLLFVAGMGFALFFAAREFMKGIRLARQEYDARLKTNQKRDRLNQDDQEGKEQPDFEPKQKSWHEVLNVPPTASVEEIKAAYRGMITLYHPDRVSGMGIELRTLAEKRAKEINGAYATARKLRGI